MGKDPAQIEREIADQRERIRVRIEGLQGRLGDDLESMRSEIQGRATHTVDQAKRTFDVQGQMNEHPYSMMAGALGLGVLLGVAGDSKGAASARTASRLHDDARPRPSFVADALLSVWGLTAGALQDELRYLLHEGMSGLAAGAQPRRGPTPAAQSKNRYEMGYAESAAEQPAGRTT